MSYEDRVDKYGGMEKAYVQPNKEDVVNKSASLQSGQLFPYWTQHCSLPLLLTDFDIDTYRWNRDDVIQAPPGLVGVRLRDHTIYAVNCDSCLVNTGLVLPDRLTTPLDVDPEHPFWRQSIEAQKEREEAERQAEEAATAGVRMDEGSLE